MSDQTNQVPDEEDQMAAALADLRTDRQEPVTEAPAAKEVGESAATHEEAPDSAATAAKPETTEPQPQAEPDEVAKNREELHRLRSEMGRVAALNRLYNETRAKAEALARENATLRSATQAPATEQAEKVDAMAKLAEVAEKVKDFPELSGLVAAVSAALTSSESKAAEVAKQTAAQVVRPLEGLRAEAEQRREMSQRAAYEAAVKQFQDAHPSAVDVIRSDDFKHWMRTAPTAIQQAFQRSNDPLDALTVMDAYEAHTRRTGKQSTPATTTSQPAQQVAKTAAVQKLTPSAQQQRLQAAAGLPSRNSGGKGGMPPEDDFEASLEFFRSQRLRRAAA